MQEDMANELSRILEKMSDKEPDTESYTKMKTNFCDLAKVFHEDLAAADDDLDHRLKRELDRANQELNERKARDAMRQAKMEAIVNLAKSGLMIVGTFGCIVLTGSLEESTILSSKCLSWIKGIAPKI